jgi:hypothetical protein
MTTHLFANKATGSLAADISAIATTMSLGVGEGSLFPNPVAGESFRVTLYSGSLSEIVEVTARAGDVFTILRARENTTGRAWSAGAAVQMRLTAEQLEDLQAGPPAVAALTPLVPLADRLAYYTGGSAAALTTLTAFARTLLASASAAAARAALSAASLTGAEGLSNKAVTASTIDNTPVGATTPSTGAFTALVCDALTLTSSTGPGMVPAGAIMMWSGAIAAIPAGWALCNGSGGTPDLRNRFVIGAHSDNAGVANTTITGSNTLSGGSKDAVVVSHTHTAAAVSGGAHQHDYTYYRGPFVSSGGGSQAYASNSNTGQTSSAGSHTHDITIDSAGVSGTNANLPPYYALAYIMKL